MENLAGVGAAYQIIRALYESLGNSEDAAEYLDLVALGTVADLADLSAENRYYTQMGLRQMNNSLRSIPGSHPHQRQFPQWHHHRGV